ncbi:MAG: hypothetical protein WB723_11570 [Candidatus Acidiferrales bacterium]
MASAQNSTDRQSLDDAWWTGPMLAPSAATLPQGHFLIEPYLYDVIQQGQYDRAGVKRKAAESNGFGSLTYVNYGLTDKLTIGVIPTFGYNRVSGAPSSSSVEMGDVTVQGQYRLTKFHEGSWVPTTSFAVQESFPSGKYDRLGNRPSDGLGSGAYTTTFAFYSQTYFWLPNRRILRMRLNVSQAISSGLNVKGVSVYGTDAEFQGHAKPGGTSFVDASWEYSLTRSWVLALDATYRYQSSAHVIGSDEITSPGVPNPRTIRLNTGFSDAIGFAPAIEYSWNSKVGILLGTRLIPAGRNTSATITPAIAINIVR